MREELKQRAKRIGIDVINLIDELPNKPSAWVISKQIVRSANSIVQIIGLLLGLNLM